MAEEHNLDLSQLEERFESVEELYESPALRSRFAICLQSLGDMERIVGRARQGSAVPNEIVALRDYLTIIPRLRELLQGCDAQLLVKLAHELENRYPLSERAKGYLQALDSIG